MRPCDWLTEPLLLDAAANQLLSHCYFRQVLNFIVLMGKDEKSSPCILHAAALHMWVRFGAGVKFDACDHLASSSKIPQADDASIWRPSYRN
jgi:hypothetical protein